MFQPRLTAPGRNLRRETDGSAPGGGCPSIPPGPPRSVPPPGPYTPNRWDESGRRKAGPGKCIPCRRPASGLRAIAAEKQLLHFAEQFRARSVQRSAPRIEDDGPLRAQPVQEQPDRLADPPPDAISRHRLAQCARSSETDSRPLRLGPAKAECGEQRARVTGALVIDSSEILRSQQADTFWKTSDGILPLGTDRQLLAAAGAPPRQHGAAILGLHATAESMGLGPVAIVRLKCAFRHSSSRIQYKRPGKPSANRRKDDVGQNFILPPAFSRRS